MLNAINSKTPVASKMPIGRSGKETDQKNQGKVTS